MIAILLMVCLVSLAVFFVRVLAGMHMPIPDNRGITFWLWTAIISGAGAGLLALARLFV